MQKQMSSIHPVIFSIHFDEMLNHFGNVYNTKDGVTIDLKKQLNNPLYLKF